jgi:ribosomal-protein-alanine N-acetyltransferase
MMSASSHLLRSDRFVLRSFNENDLENVFLGLSDPAVIKYYGVHFTSREETRKQLEWFAELEREGTGIWWAICSPDQSIFQGAAGLYYLNKTHRKAEIGCWLLPSYWGKGLMQEVMEKVVQYGFSHLRLHRIEGLVETDNMNCKKAMLKSDFSHEGTMKDCEIKNGQWISLDIYARINKDPSFPENPTDL